MSENHIGNTCSASAPMGQIEFMIRFEDLNLDNDGSDDDFSDLIVSLDIGTATARQMIAASIASNIDLTGVDNAGLVSATITIPMSCQKGDTVEPPGGILNGSGISAIDARNNSLNRYLQT